MRTYFDFGDFAVGRVVDNNSFEPIYPATYASGNVTTIYPEAPLFVGVTTIEGTVHTIRVQS